MNTPGPDHQEGTLMDKQNPSRRRSYGTGSLIEHRGAWYGQWRAHGRLIKRKIAPIKTPTAPGLTRTQAERELRRLIERTTVTASPEHRAGLVDVARALIDSREALGLKRSTILAYRSMLRVHLEPVFADVAIADVDPEDLERFMAWMRAEGRSTKTIMNTLGLLHGIFEHGIRRGHCTQNPCKRIDKPRRQGTDAAIRFLDDTELEALLRAAPDNAVGRMERVMYLAAAMTGLRQGELLGLQWQDIDWLNGRVRVRRSYVRGHFDTPKSRRSSRSVPLALRLAAELERFHQATDWDADTDLVFAHPVTGKPLDRSKLLKRFKQALKRAHVRPVRFHDLRHTFGTRMAGAGVPMRTLQEWMGHRDSKTTEIYADYQPSHREADWIEQAFNPAGINPGINLHATGTK